MSRKKDKTQQPASGGVNDQVVLRDKVEPEPKSEQLKGKAAAEYSSPYKNPTLSMEVKVYSPFRDYYDGPAFSISAENTTGPFDILPKHHNFITLLTACDMVLRTPDQGNQKIKISGGIMHVKADKVIVFLDV